MHIKAMMVLALVLILNVQPTAADQDQFKKVFQDLDHEFSTVNRDSDEQKQDFNKFRKVQEEAFQAFRDERDRDFTAFLKAEWEAFAEMQGLVERRNMAPLFV